MKPWAIWVCIVIFAAVVYLVDMTSGQFIARPLIGQIPGVWIYALAIVMIFIGSQLLRSAQTGSRLIVGYGLAILGMLVIGGLTYFMRESTGLTWSDFLGHAVDTVRGRR